MEKISWGWGGNRADFHYRVTLYWVGDYLVTLSFVQHYLRKYNTSEVETLLVGTVWWEDDATTDLISIHQRVLLKLH